MRAVVQRVKNASVTVGGSMVGEIDRGLLVYLGVGHADQPADVRYLADKILRLRIFEDEDGKMNRSVADEGGGILVVSQFTLYGDCRKGNRPGWSEAARPETAVPLYESFVAHCRTSGLKVETGVFQAMMDVAYTNDGPVTLLLDSAKEF